MHKLKIELTAAILTLTVALTVSSPALGEPPSTALVKMSEVVEQLELRRNHLNAPIRSERDLEKELQNPSSPLYALSHAGRQVFLDSLVFSKNGLGSFRTVELEAELTPTQILAVLKLFGFQKAVPGFQNARIETEEDVRLLTRSDDVTTMCTGDYFPGKCYSKGTCIADWSFCCHPPSCPEEP